MTAGCGQTNRLLDHIVDHQLRGNDDPHMNQPSLRADEEPSKAALRINFVDDPLERCSRTVLVLRRGVGLG